MRVVADWKGSLTSAFLLQWAPVFRVVMLHSSSGSWSEGSAAKEAAVLTVVSAKGSGVLVTTFEGLRRNTELLLPYQWAYAVLDEGHKIRNPDADITLACKKLNTHHRLILTGTPIQNSLKELWSLMDFVYPGKLGTLPVFQRELSGARVCLFFSVYEFAQNGLRHRFEIPIQLGGYASASPSQVITATRCSVVLKDLVKPYLLRRLKMDVDVALPDKSEHVLMCRLCPEQVAAYRQWLRSDEVQRILDGRLNALYGIAFLRKICNHPDLLMHDRKAQVPDYGAYTRSAKMVALHDMLGAWKRDGHRVLIFSQGLQMLDVLESYLRAQGHTYLRLDGGTSVQNRVPLIDRFNSDSSIFAFVLTTRVGGIGVNLTGADRVVIFDPDWNPSTDMQARERAWRIGQQRHVMVYRLVTAGTIEEKVLHRQIFKTFLTQKVLKNPRQRRFFDHNEMADLFTLGPQYNTHASGAEREDTATQRMFRHTQAAPVEATPRALGQDRDDDVLLRTLLTKNEGVISALDHGAMVDDQVRCIVRRGRGRW